MKTVRDACQIQPNALPIKLIDQIEQLDELISTEDNGETFFEKTFITQGMRTCSNQTIDLYTNVQFIKSPQTECLGTETVANQVDLPQSS